MFQYLQKISSAPPDKELAARYDRCFNVLTLASQLKDLKNYQSACRPAVEKAIAQYFDAGRVQTNQMITNTPSKDYYDQQIKELQQALDKFFTQD